MEELYKRLESHCTQSQQETSSSFTTVNMALVSFQVKLK
jgi:hypothetical protein